MKLKIRTVVSNYVLNTSVSHIYNANSLHIIITIIISLFPFAYKHVQTIPFIVIFRFIFNDTFLKHFIIIFTNINKFEENRII